jgi:hypothetical protein
MYLGQPGFGVVMLLTFGFCGVGQVFDLFLLPDVLNKANQRIGVLSPEEAIVNRPSATTSQRQQIANVADISPHDDELDQLLCQAENSIKLTENSPDIRHGH